VLNYSNWRAVCQPWLPSSQATVSEVLAAHPPLWCWVWARDQRRLFGLDFLWIYSEMNFSCWHRVVCDWWLIPRILVHGIVSVTVLITEMSSWLLERLICLAWPARRVGMSWARPPCLAMYEIVHSKKLKPTTINIWYKARQPSHEEVLTLVPNTHPTLPWGSAALELHGCWPHWEAWW